MEVLQKIRIFNFVARAIITNITTKIFMGKLFTLLLFFVGLVIALLLVFNTFGNTSKQIQPTTSPELLTLRDTTLFEEATMLPTQSAEDYRNYNQWVKKKFNRLFANANMEWQTFDKYSLVGKWIGRNSSLAPLVLVASPTALLQDTNIAAAQNSTLLTGANLQSSKMASVALLSALQTLVKTDVLPARTLYVVFPHEVATEKRIVQALSTLKQAPYLILKTGGGVVENGFWEIDQPIGLIGVGNKVKQEATYRLVHKEGLAYLLDHIDEQATPLVVEHPVVKDFVYYLSPATTFGKRMLWSNPFFLGSWQRSNLEQNPISNHYLDRTYRWTASADSTNTKRVTIQAYTQQPLPADWAAIGMLKTIRLVEQLPSQPAAQHISSTNSPTYRLINTTCKEIFEGALTAPCLVADPLLASYASISPEVYYFSPIYHQVAQPIPPEELQKAVQFYYRLLETTLIE